MIDKPTENYLNNNVYHFPNRWEAQRLGKWLKMSYYVKRTNLEKAYNPVVRAPIRAVDLNTDYETMARAPITNVENAYDETSIMAHLDKSKNRLSDISGMTLLMICRVDNDIITKDIVTVVGERTIYYIVTLSNGETLSVAKSCVIFARNNN